MNQDGPDSGAAHGGVRDVLLRLEIRQAACDNCLWSFVQTRIPGAQSRIMKLKLLGSALVRPFQMLSFLSEIDTVLQLDFVVIRALDRTE